MNFEPVPVLQGPHPSLQAPALVPTKCAMATFSLCSNVATRLLTGMRPRPLALLEARWLAPARRLLSRPLETRGAFTPIVQQCVAIWPEALRPLFVDTAPQF